MNKKLVEFELEDGSTISIEQPSRYNEVKRSGKDMVETSMPKFEQAVNQVKPAAKAVLNAFKEMNTPDEINLEFGMKFSASAGAIIASVDSEATFKVNLTWKKPAASE